MEHPWLGFLSELTHLDSGASTYSMDFSWDSCYLSKLIFLYAELEIVLSIIDNNSKQINFVACKNSVL